VLISNQAAYAKGKTDLRSLWLAHERFVELLAGEGVRVDAAFYSYGHPEGVMPHFSGPSLDRKPGPYNLFIAVAQLDLDLARSWMIGDRETDVACAHAAGLRAILIENPHTDLRNAPAATVAKSLSDAVQILASPNLDGHDRCRRGSISKTRCQRCYARRPPPGE
jgi:D-glycero-D-manno-heptose 1,7-bisphosphate phosphatase